MQHGRLAAREAGGAGGAAQGWCVKLESAGRDGYPRGCCVPARQVMKETTKQLRIAVARHTQCACLTHSVALASLPLAVGLFCGDGRRVGGEPALAACGRPDWPGCGVLCLSAALSRRFSSSTTGYISPKLDPPTAFSSSNCSPPPAPHRHQRLPACSQPHPPAEPSSRTTPPHRTLPLHRHRHSLALPPGRLF